MFRVLMASAVMLICTVMGVHSQTPFYVVSSDDFYQELTNSATLERPLIANAIHKTGAGILTIQNPRMPRAKLEVLEGCVAISLTNTFENPGLPVALQQRAAFRVNCLCKTEEVKEL